MKYFKNSHRKKLDKYKISIDEIKNSVLMDSLHVVHPVKGIIYLILRN